MMWIYPSLAVVFFVLRAIYRLYFHPLAKIPGPRLAAISSLPEFYYDVLCDGRYLWQIEKMHQKYGPVVRINPYQLHINDPTFYGEICAAGGRKRNKSFATIAGLRANESLPSIIEHDHHWRRRKQLNPAFSKKSILTIVPLIQQKIGLVLEHLETARKDGQHVELDPEFTGLTADTVTQYTYGKDLGFLRDRKFNNVILAAMREMTDQFHLNRFFPWLGSILGLLPAWFMRRFRPQLAGIYELQERLNGEPETKILGMRTVIDILSDPSLPAEARSPEFIRDNVNIILGAATETTSGTLLMGVFQLVQRPDLWRQLRDELQTIMPEPTDEVPAWTELEQLPLMRAVFHEVLRFSPGTIRIARVPVSETLVCQGHVIPPGATVSSSARLIHMHKDPFPDPHTFRPERWVEADPKQHSMMLQALVAFSRGNRNCIGHYLATAEIYMILAAIIRRFDLELYETTAANVEFARDCLVARPVAGVWSVKVRVTGIAN